MGGTLLHSPVPPFQPLLPLLPVLPLPPVQPFPPLPPHREPIRLVVPKGVSAIRQLVDCAANRVHELQQLGNRAETDRDCLPRILAVAQPPDETGSLVKNR